MSRSSSVEAASAPSVVVICLTVATEDSLIKVDVATLHVEMATLHVEMAREEDAEDAAVGEDLAPEVEPRP